MCKKLKSNIVLGNLILQSIKCEKTEFKFEQLEEFEMNLNRELEFIRCDTFTKIEISDLFEFEDENSNLLKIHENSIEIMEYDEKTSNSLYLERMFSFGLPTEIFNCIEQVTKNIFLEKIRL